MKSQYSFLVVEDDPITADIIATAIQHLGNVRIASTSEMARTYTREYLPDVILLDIHLPDTDGIALCAELKASSFASSAKIIFVTADHANQTELNAFEQGADDFVRKPINTAVLVARVSTQLMLIRNRRQLLQVNHFQSTLFSRLPSYVSCWDSELNNVFNNDTNGSWFSHTHNRSKFPISDLFTPTHFQIVKQHLTNLTRKSSIVFELSNVYFGSTLHHLRVSLLSERLVNSQIGFVMVLTDITDQQSKLDSLLTDQQKYQTALTEIEEGVIVTDTTAHITYINRMAQEFTGKLQNSALGRHIDEVMQIYDVVDGTRLPNSIHYAMEEKQSVGNLPEACLRTHHGKVIEIEEVSSPIYDNDSLLIGGISVFHDVTHVKQQERELNYIANHDRLTGLPNRVLLIDRLEQCLKKNERDHSYVAVVVANIDHFQKINESHGYEVGDKVLKDVAHFLASFLRESDTLCRHSGDEFIILLPSIESYDHIETFCTRLLSAFNSKLNPKKLAPNLTITMGIAVAPHDANDAQTLYRMADSAMHEAKRNSRNNFRFYSDDIQQKLAQQLVSINELANAISEHELQVYYQPKIDINSNTIVGVEALVRWHKADGTVVMPNDFIPLAESSNLIIPLGEYVLKSACAEVAKWHKNYPDITLAVNVSSVQFNPSFITLLDKVLADTHFPPEQFEVEITETILINNVHAIETFNLLKKAKVKISLDDFGTGYSSLSYVKNFPFDILKIDQSFVMSMLNDHKNMSIVKTIINFAKDLSLVPVAEGVESQEHANTLKALGCSLLQGYFYSKPIPASGIRAYLNNF